MSVEEPAWWYADAPTWQTKVLIPVAALYAKLALRRLATTKPYRSPLPVICIGNFTAGGTGKTPLAIRTARELIKLGRRPVFLSRGYGGRVTGPHLVAPAEPASLVGDEPLLLARVAPVMIARNRADGARAIEALTPERAADVIIMDDGLQNPQLTKTLVIAVVDGRRGLGNGLVIPAGPLRAPLLAQVGMTDAIVVNQPASAEPATRVSDALRAAFHGPVLACETRPVPPLDWLKDGSFIAYCGIGAPRRFFDLLKSLGASIAAEEAFADHYAFSDADANRLLTLAQSHGAQLVTTEKDRVRLNGFTGPRGLLREQSKVLAIEAAFETRDDERFAALLRGALAQA